MRRLAALLLVVLAVRAFAEEGETAVAPSVGSPVPVLRAASGGDKIWSAVILATNSATPKEAPPELGEFTARLKRVFGYTQYELIGSVTEKIDDKSESWLVPSRNFWLQVKARHISSKEARGGYLLNLQFFQDKRPILESEAKLAPGSPLFVRGPEYGRGQIIIVLQVQR
ncbi:MAG: hypothetical protein K8R23_18420 [Chthoniobacter sp.]|nr:hypothetical protein [Chthoniobacter sp.]